MTSLTPSATATADDLQFNDRMVHEITSLAEALQEREHHRSGNLIATEVEAAGAEVGIAPDFIRRAISEVNQRAAAARLAHGRRVEFGSLLGALLFPLVWGALAYWCGFSHGLQQFFTLIAPAPLALILGFVAGRKSAGTIAGISLMLSLAPALSEMLTRMHSHNKDTRLCQQVIHHMPVHVREAKPTSLEEVCQASVIHPQ
jgi:hypothetical protein